jgi:hypothetical protein
MDPTGQNPLMDPTNSTGCDKVKPYFTDPSATYNPDAAQVNYLRSQGF